MRVESLRHAISLFRDAVAGVPGSADSLSLMVEPQALAERFEANRMEAAEIAAYSIFREVHDKACSLDKASYVQPELRNATKRVLFELTTLALSVHHAIALRDNPDIVKRSLERFGNTWDVYQVELTHLLDAREQSRAGAERDEEPEHGKGVGR